MRLAPLAGETPDIGEKWRSLAGLCGRGASRCRKQAACGSGRSKKKDPQRLALRHRTSIGATETAIIGCHDVLPCVRAPYESQLRRDESRRIAPRSRVPGQTARE